MRASPDGRDPEEIVDPEESAEQPFSDRPGAPADAELRAEIARLKDRLQSLETKLDAVLS